MFVYWRLFYFTVLTPFTHDCTVMMVMIMIVRPGDVWTHFTICCRLIVQITKTPFFQVGRFD